MRERRGWRSVAKTSWATSSTSRTCGALLFTAAAMISASVMVSANAFGADPPSARTTRDRDEERATFMPPWAEPNDIPVPTWARSIVPNKADAAFYAEPGKLDARRGSAELGARFPLFATRRANGCQGRWLNVGPLAWICSDVAEYSGDDPGVSAGLAAGTFFGSGRAGARGLLPVEAASGDDGLPYRYYFAGRDGAYGFANLANALDDAPDQELEQGFAVAIVEEKRAHGESWGRTKKGRWIAMHELVAARPSLFHGELLDPEAKTLDFGWISTDRANVYATDRTEKPEKAEKPSGVRVRFERVKIFEERESKSGAMLRLSADGESPVWIRARDVSRPRLAAPPPEVGGGEGETAAERWIDVDLAQQTLVAYEGTRPVFATLVSTGKGAPKTEMGTNPGVHRIWVKIATTKMDNLDKEDAERHYAIEDVPWVQFFDKGIALHGAFWHRDFGHVHSHGCVNLTPLDARWLFAFTGPHLPVGWTAVLPTKLEPGTVVRVR